MGNTHQAGEQTSIDEIPTSQQASSYNCAENQEGGQVYLLLSALIRGRSSDLPKVS